VYAMKQTNWQVDKVDERQSIVSRQRRHDDRVPQTRHGFRHSTDVAGQKTRARTSFELVEGLGIVEELGMLAGRRKGVECRLTSRRRVSGVFVGKHGGLRREGIYCWLRVLPAGLGRAQL